MGSQREYEYCDVCQKETLWSSPSRGLWICADCGKETRTRTMAEARAAILEATTKLEAIITDSSLPAAAHQRALDSLARWDAIAAKLIVAAMVENNDLSHPVGDN